MANPQKENGYTPIANDLFEAFYTSKFTEYERICVLHIWRKTYGWNKKSDWIANSQFSLETGIPRPHVTRTINELKKKKVVVKDDKKLAVNKNYDEWLVKSRVTSSGNSVTSSGNKSLPVQVPTKEKKETITKDTSEAVASRSKSSMQNLIPNVIKLFEEVDPKNKTYYGNKTQRAACEFLLQEYGLEEVKKRVQILPKTNQMQFFPNITTPCQLRDKWVQLDSQIKRHQIEQVTKNNQVIW